MTGKCYPPIYFYVPHEIFTEIPNDEAEFLKWEERGEYHGVASWVVLTYLRIRESQLHVEFIRRVPDSGIVITHARILRDMPVIVPPQVMLVCIEGDRGRSAAAAVHLVQNPVQESRATPWRRIYIPYWTQPGLIPRRSDRGNRFESLAFFGNQFNLAPELHEEAWTNELNRMDLQWDLRLSHERWYDYSGVDGVIAIRSFRGHWNEIWKPANKLFNAWAAGAIPVVGPESAMLHHGTHRRDCMICHSVEEAISCIAELKESSELRALLRANGAERAMNYRRAAVARLWGDLIETVLVPMYWERSQSSAKRSLHRIQAATTYLLDWGDRYRRYFGGRIAARFRGEVFRGYV